MRLAGRGSAEPLSNRSATAAFLCYHSIDASGPPFLSLSPETFERQLALLRRKGWRTGGLTDLAALAAGQRLGAPRVFLTFDDGFHDNYSQALPLLKAYGARALIFLLPTAVDAGGPLNWPEVSERFTRHPDVFRSMTWDMVGEMGEAGVEFGSHTLRHPDLSSLDDEQLRQELLDSRRRMTERLDRCDSLAYPFGYWDARVASAAGDAGYRWAFTMPSDGQASADALSIPRIAVDHRDAERRFALKLMAAGRSVLLSETLKARLRGAQDLLRRAARR